jgi:hypothetical protein
MKFQSYYIPFKRQSEDSLYNGFLEIFLKGKPRLYGTNGAFINQRIPINFSIQRGCQLWSWHT